MVFIIEVVVWYFCDKNGLVELAGDDCERNELQLVHLMSSSSPAYPWPLPPPWTYPRHFANALQQRSHYLPWPYQSIFHFNMPQLLLYLVFNQHVLEILHLTSQKLD